MHQLGVSTSQFYCGISNIYGMKLKMPLPGQRVMQILICFPVKVVNKIWGYKTLFVRLSEISPVFNKGLSSCFPITTGIRLLWKMLKVFYSTH